MDKYGLIAGILLAALGMYKIDVFLIPTLDYFGKYVFFTSFNIFVFWVVWVFHKKFSGVLKTVMPSLFGFIVMIVGLKMF